MTRTLFLLCLAAALFSAACESAPARRHTHERLHSTLYLQRSAEYQASCLQAYRMAAEKLDAALKDPSWTAEETQKGDIAALPPAVILDIDETVLDNSPYYGQVVRKDAEFDLKQWNRWVVRAEAELIAGTADFIAAAQKAGVAVYFITNRDARLEGFTRLNLERRGIALDPKVDTVLMLNETPDWKFDKTTRRAFVAQTHRILLNIGDNLNDFSPIEKLDEAGRKELVARTGLFWGTRWFAIPNPGYGNWIDDLMKNIIEDQLQLDRKFESLRAAPEVSDDQMTELMLVPVPIFPIQLYIETFKFPAKPKEPAAAESSGGQDAAPVATEDPDGQTATPPADGATPPPANPASATE